MTQSPRELDIARARIEEVEILERRNWCMEVGKLKRRIRKRLTVTMCPVLLDALDAVRPHDRNRSEQIETMLCTALTLSGATLVDPRLPCSNQLHTYDLPKCRQRSRGAPGAR